MSEGIPSVWPADRITDCTDVQDRIHNAVLAERRRLIGQAGQLVAEERERCARIINGVISTIAAEYGGYGYSPELYLRRAEAMVRSGR